MIGPSTTQPSTPRLCYAVIASVIWAGVAAWAGEARAETKTVAAEASYTMDDRETPATAEAIALYKAKDLTAQDAAASIRKWVKTTHPDFTTEDLHLLALAALQVNAVEAHRTLAGNALTLSMKIQGVLHSDRVTELADRLAGKAYTGQHKKIREDYAAVFRELDQLRASRVGEYAGFDSQFVRDRIHEQEKAFARIQQQETALYERLVKGNDLHAKAEQQVAEQRTKPQKQAAAINAVFEEIVHHGHEIRIGEPEVKARLEEKGQADLYYPVSITGNPTVRGKIKEALASFGGDISNATYRKVEQRLANIWFVLELLLSDGGSRVCYVPTHLSKFQADGEFIAMEDGTSRWKVRIPLPMTALKEIAGVRGRFMETMPGPACGVSRG